MKRSLRPAVFLDRDGTLNVEKEYLWRIEEFEFVPGVPEAVRRLNRAGFLVVVITNQSGVARGYFQMEDVHRLHRHIQNQLKEHAAHIDAFYICPHHPEYGDPPTVCLCRKPSPGLLLDAACDLGIDLGASYMIGDKVADIEAGRQAGCRPLLVQTGYGRITLEAVSALAAGAFSDLPEAVEWILAQCGRRLVSD